MKIRLYNARLLTMAEGKKIFRGEVHTEDDKITFVGASDQAPAGDDWDREIDVNGDLLMPGFKDAHTHSAMTFLRSKADDLPLQEWLAEQVFPREAKLTPEDIVPFYKLAVMEYLTSGITAAFDMYMFMDESVKASVECGFRSVLVPPLSDFVSSPEEQEEQYLRFNRVDPLISCRLGFHAEYTTCEERLKGIAALAKKYKAPVYAHNSETEREVKECIERHGMTPTAYMNSLGMFEYGGGGYHCVYMSDEDMNIFREKGLVAVSNPGSNTKLASGIAPLKEFLDRGITVALGTDGPASNNCLDMFREMFLAAGLAKLREKDAEGISAFEVLKMATTGGCAAMGLEDCDVLAPGKQADLIRIDLHQPNMQPIHDIANNLVYSGSKSNVKMTMIAGKILYENGEFYIGVSPEEIYRQVQERTEALMKR